MSCRLRPLDYAAAVEYSARANRRFPGCWGQSWCSACKADHVRLRFPAVFRGYPIVKREVRPGSVSETIGNYIHDYSGKY